MPYNKNMDTILIDKIKELATQGHCAEKIAKLVGKCASTIRYQIKINKIQTVSGINKISGDVEKQIRELILQNAHASEIERITGIDYNTILYWANKNNIKLING